MVVASGTDEHRHAYWFLCEAIALDRIESLNRRLAAALGADERSADAARILRPAGSVNRKYQPPTAVRRLRIEPRSCVPIRELEAVLPGGQAGVGMSRRTREIRTASSDSLRAVSPSVYVARLTGQPVGRSGKIRCPFHDDQTPSLHVYEDSERGWYCFGCGRGGSVYDLAALLWQRSTRGEDFLQLRSVLEAALF